MRPPSAESVRKALDPSVLIRTSFTYLRGYSRVLGYSGTRVLGYSRVLGADPHVVHVPASSESTHGSSS